MAPRDPFLLLASEEGEEVWWNPPQPQEPLATKTFDLRTADEILRALYVPHIQQMLDNHNVLLRFLDG